jgi:transcriptional regulator with XRE-family HTH domain
VTSSADESKFLNRLAANAKKARAKARLTQQAVADAADLDIRTIQKIEAGKLNILVTTAARVRQALGCEWDDLLG